MSNKKNNRAAREWAKRGYKPTRQLSAASTPPSGGSAVMAPQKVTEKKEIIVYVSRMHR